MDTENMDKGAMREFEAAQDRLSTMWQVGTNEILAQKNPELLKELKRLESIIDSLMVIPNKPAPLRKQWKDALEQYEKTGMLCVTYAKRHMPVPQGN